MYHIESGQSSKFQQFRSLSEGIQEAERFLFGGNLILEDVVTWVMDGSSGMDRVEEWNPVVAQEPKVFLRKKRNLGEDNQSLECNQVAARQQFEVCCMLQYQT
ncbi:hypothetical protein BCR33DRAFT_737583 [Rhizoclosmatium globosum]|uniref:Uncharacterized protein n=1 Tax=Rhizoclosmatium globosum TaxID=329046 RepID=A0A1Y2CEI2_9FUNG|nr:hypothetical protein BCR33DRAFT_737583 [Rhizoclosmatium globosum]|eukprot:ORY45214.1 hypothetical protein BCR33DRAFT_737583 [Rhizoclosmatium globosum]